MNLSAQTDAGVLNILYVEDNPIVREVTSELLSHEGRKVVAHATAEEALQEFTRARFDIVITDVSLPVMSGLDLARSILRIRPSTPIIIASGYALGAGLKDLGASVRSIVKPFEAGEIDTLIASMAPA